MQTTAWVPVVGLGGRTPATVRQVHGARVLDLREFPGRQLSGADALIADLAADPSRFPVIRTADCVPILIADPATRTVAAIHSGWRGTAARVVPETIARFSRLGISPDQLRLAIGPAIGACCYQVGDSVRRVLGDAVRGALPGPMDAPTGSVDLKRIVAAQARNAGVPPGRIWSSNVCTSCDSERWCSFRRDGQGAGRQSAFIGLP